MIPGRVPHPIFVKNKYFFEKAPVFFWSNNYHLDLHEALSSSRRSLQPSREDILLLTGISSFLLFRGDIWSAWRRFQDCSHENFDCGFKLWTKSLPSG
jgi:hypothetical protein